MPAGREQKGKGENKLMNKLKDIITELNLNVLSVGDNLDIEVTSGCCCDLLSWVMANGRRMISDNSSDACEYCGSSFIA